MKHYFFVNGRRVTRLPAAPVTPPTREQLKWLLREPYANYGIDERKRLWHLSHLDAAGRNWQTRQIAKVVKNGYPVYTLRKDGRRVQLSQRQLNRLCYRNPSWEK